MNIYQRKNKILENINIHGDYFKLSLEAGWLAKTSRPGQFIEVKVSDDHEVILRKPLGIHRIGSRFSVLGSRRTPNTEHRTPKVVEVLYEVVGKGTKALSGKKRGETLDIIGPLGNGFDYGFSGLGSRGSAKKPILIAGGIGVAPLVYLAQRLKCHSEGAKRPKNLKILRPCGAQDDISKPIVLLGARTKKDILCEKEFRKLGCEVKVATDDGSRGHNGFITDLLKDILREPITDNRTPAIYACGPKSMLKETANIAVRHKILCQVLLEEYMACGLGVCLGCPVKTKDGYKMVCKDGPVFDASEVIWE